MRISDWSSDVCSSDLMAPLAVAKEKGFFEDEGLYVTLEPQANWKVLLDRVITGELDGAHMLAGQPLAATIGFGTKAHIVRSEEHTSELQSLMRISYAVFCLKKKKNTVIHTKHQTTTHIQPRINKANIQNHNTHT